MTLGSDNVKAAVLEECPTCFRERFLTDAGECAGCVADAEREVERQRRAEARAYDRAVLGFMPAAKSLAFTRQAISAGIYWTGWATRYVTPGQLPAVEAARDLLAEAWRELEAIR